MDDGLNPRKMGFREANMPRQGVLGELGPVQLRTGIFSLELSVSPGGARLGKGGSQALDLMVYGAGTMFNSQ